MAVIKKLLAVILLCLPALLWAESWNSELLLLQQEWARVNYQTEGDVQVKAFEGLLQQCELLNKKYSKVPELLIWNGIVESSYAGAKGGMGALKHAKKAKKLFEEAIKLNPKALDGSAYTSLGVLYYKVPGFPIGFGSKKKAIENLQTALEINPNGIDSNYFNADFLIEQKRYQDAIPLLEKALSAPDRLNRPLADEGRRKEIQQALVKARSKLQ